MGIQTMVKRRLERSKRRTKRVTKTIDDQEGEYTRRFRFSRPVRREEGITHGTRSG